MRPVAAALGALALAAAAAADDRLGGRPDAIVDLGTPEGVALVRGQWRHADARVVETDFRAPGPDLRPSGPPTRTWDVEPRAGARDFDDSGWAVLDPPRLDARRGSGRLSFGWYRLRLTIPERVGALDPTGATVVLEVVADDYAEVWVDGRLPLVLGQSGGAVVGGFNAPNRVVLTRDARPGQTIQVAVFGANGPLSAPPDNFIWLRSATLDVYRTPPDAPDAVPAEVRRRDPGLDAIVPASVRVERVARGFLFTEGPVWVPDGHLLFSDPDANRIYRWSLDGTSVFRPKSGYTGVDVAEWAQPGANGLALDAAGRLTICEHGNRRVTRLERNGVLTVLADRFEGRRLNSPNDLAYRGDGTLCFSDPPFGLPRQHDDPRRELPWSGVFCLRDGALRLVTNDLSGPNGVAFSPDDRFLYVTNWDPARKVVMRYDLADDAAVRDATVLLDLTGERGDEALDGIEVDRDGNVWVAGPGGVWIASQAGRLLGTIRLPEVPANFAWGDDGGTLYVTARTSVYRMRPRVPGARR
jgi:gluconolactonase